jgi:hypothetical protein
MKRSVVSRSPAFAGSLYVGLILCVGANVARADTGMLPGGASLAFKRTFIHENNNPASDKEASTELAALKYFNGAHCVCSQPMSAGDRPDFFEKTFAQEVVLTPGTMPISRPLQFWAGVDCQTELDRVNRCSQVAPDIAMISNLATAPAVVDIRTFDLINAKPGSIPCDPETAPASNTLWGMADLKSTGMIDFAISKVFATDIKPPPLPELSTFHAQGAENAIELSWTPPADASDIFFYQALCADAGGAPVTSTPPEAQYQTPRSLCGANSLSLGQVAIDNGTGIDGGPLPEPDGIATQDPAFICGEQSDKTAGSLRIAGLQNGKAYSVALLVIDRSGNAVGVFFTSELTPKPATDFWEDLHDRGGHTEGGFCLIAETYGDDNPLTRSLRTFRDETLAETAFGRWASTAYYASLGKLGALVHGHLALRILSGIVLLPLVAVALLWHVLTLPGLLLLVGFVWLARRHRRRIFAARVVAAAAVACVLFAPHRAHAQTPYWEDQTGTDESSPTADQPARVKWHAGVRVGPYIPGIDKQLGLSPGPYKAMFGDSGNPSAYAILPMLDVERIVWRGFGQLGFGGSAGFMGKKAHAFVAGSDPNDPNRPRSAGDTNSFRLVPLSANAVYRFSYLDDEYGIPIVPYVKAGLAYYIWWVNAPSGDFAKICKDGGMEPCALNKAAGASLGVQGTIGIAIRAERIDATAAQSMHNSGIEHAGFYAEFQAAKVDGFGSAKKLSVGDNTWFAGVDFEF